MQVYAGPFKGCGQTLCPVDIRLPWPGKLCLAQKFLCSVYSCMQMYAGPLKGGGRTNIVSSGRSPVMALKAVPAIMPCSGICCASAGVCRAFEGRQQGGNPVQQAFPRHPVPQPQDHCGLPMAGVRNGCPHGGAGSVRTQGSWELQRILHWWAPSPPLKVEVREVESL